MVKRHTRECDAVGYIGETVGDGMGVERHGDTSRRYLTDWHGNVIGHVALDTGWRVNSAYGSHMYQAYATLSDQPGRTYTGRTWGKGMSVCLRETAKSKAKRKA